MNVCIAKCRKYRKRRERNSTERVVRDGFLSNDMYGTYEQMGWTEF